MPSVRDLLARFVAIGGVQVAVLVGRDGLLIEAAGQGDARAHEAYGALGASALGTAEALGHEVSAGKTVGVVLEYETALTLVHPVGPYAALVTLAESAASLSEVRRLLQATAGELLRALDLE